MKISDSDILSAARENDIDPVDLAALIEIESQGSGYLGDGRLKILYEPHIFHGLTDGAHGEVKPISARAWSTVRSWGYGSLSEQYERRSKAARKDKDAAYQACSYGAFQLLGTNYRAAGYDNIHAMVDDLEEKPRAHLQSIIRWMTHEGLLELLRRREMEAFFRAYNGPAWREHGYGRRFEEAKARHEDRFADIHLEASGEEEPAVIARRWDASDMPVIRRGDRSQTVAKLRQALTDLGYDVDGRGPTFGPNTKRAVEEFQEDAGIAVDGIVGPQTWAALKEAADGLPDEVHAPPDGNSPTQTGPHSPPFGGFFNALWRWLRRLFA